MFDLRRLVRKGRPTGQAVDEQTGRTLSLRESVKLVAITQNPDDAETLHQIASSCGWRISIVPSSSAAIAALNEQPTPLVICDHDLSGEAWRDVLAKMAALPQAICVLLASRVVDDYLWYQVIRYHGYDVVRKPFQPDELRHAIIFAWSWCDWAHRHNTEVVRKPVA
jgi:DNA-binding response OmpR family regulator